MAQLEEETSMCCSWEIPLQPSHNFSSLLLRRYALIVRALCMTKAYRLGCNAMFIPYIKMAVLIPDLCVIHHHHVVHLQAPSSCHCVVDCHSLHTHLFVNNASCACFWQKHNALAQICPKLDRPLGTCLFDE